MTSLPPESTDASQDDQEALESAADGSGGDGAPVDADGDGTDADAAEGKSNPGRGGADADAVDGPSDSETEADAALDLGRRVKARIEGDDISFAKAAMDIGVSYLALLGVVNGKGMADAESAAKYEAWLTGAAAHDILSPPPPSFVPPKRRGRPPKSPSQRPSDGAELAVVPKRRGRPPKVRPAPGAEAGDGAKEEAGSEGSAEDAAATSAASPADPIQAGGAPAPKRRGRPPKVRPDASTDPAEAGEAPAPKRRGRPPKVRPAEADPSSVGAGDASAPVGDGAAAATPKRRGRPPKIRPSAEAAAEVADDADAAPAGPSDGPETDDADGVGSASTQGGGRTIRLTITLPSQRGRQPKPASKPRGGQALPFAEVAALVADDLAIAIHRGSERLRAIVAKLAETI